MKSRAKLFMITLMMILTVLLTVYITYAWFTVSEKSRPIIITTGSLKQSSHFYVGVDENFDGELEGGYTELTQGGYSIPAVIPGQIYTFKIIVINDGTVPGKLSITMNNIVSNSPELLDYFELVYTDPATTSIITRSLVYIPGVDPDVDPHDIILIDDLTLEINGGASFELDFTIRAKEIIPSNLGEVTLTITNYIINLVQQDFE